MKYSYISPRHKTFVTPELQLLFSFFSIAFIMLFLTYSYLLFKDYQFGQNTQDMIEQKVELQVEVKKINAQIAFIEKEVLLSEKVYTKNTILKDSIANLFDIVPQRITLSQATLLRNGLILHGVSPSKDLYNFMLHAPLRSIFHKTHTTFYPAKNGWISFVSTNYIDEDELELMSEDSNDEY